MMDRFGSAWKPHWRIWVESALQLDLLERRGAFLDIAALTGKSLKAVQMKAQHIQDQAKAELEWATDTHRRPLPISMGQPSAFRWPSSAAKMAGKANLAPSASLNIDHNA